MKKLIICCMAFAAPATAQTFYVTDQQGGVTPIDGTDFTRGADIDIGGKGPRGIAVTHDGALLITANQGTGDISLIDRKTGKLISRVATGPSTEMVRVQGRTAFVTYEPPTDKGGLAHIAMVDLDKKQVVNSIPSGHETEGLEFSPDGKSLLVTNEGDDTVSVYGLPDGKLVQSVNTKSFGDRPRGIKRLPSGQGYVVSLEFSDKVLVLNSTFAVTGSFATAGGPYGMAFSPDGKHLFVSAGKAGLLQEFDAATYAHLGDAKVGKRCWHFSFTADGNHILDACGRSGAVYVVDTSTLAIVKTIDGFKLPWGVASYPNTSGTLDIP